MDSTIRVINFNEIDKNIHNRMDFNCIDGIHSLKGIESKYKLVKLGKLIKSLQSGSTPAKDKLLPEGDIPFIRAEALENERINVEKIEKFISKETSKEMAAGSLIKGGEVLFTIAGTIGNCAINENVYGNTNQAIAIIDIDEDQLDKEYFVMLTKSSFFKLQGRTMTTFGAIPNINTKKIKEFLIPLPSITEQRKTVTFVNERVSSIKEQIKTIGDKIDGYSIRNLIDELLHSECGIQKHDDLVLDETFYNAPTFDNLSDRLDFNYMIYKNSIEKSQSNSIYVKLKDFLKINPRKNVVKGTELIGRVIDFKDIISFTGKINDEEDGTIKLDSDKTKFGDNDIMFSKFNPQFGKNVIVTKEMENYVGSAELWGLKLNKDKVVPQYLLYALASTELFNSFCYLVTGAKLILDGNGRSRITSNQFLNLKIPLPELDLQKEICLKINMERSKISVLNEHITLLENIIQDSLDISVLQGYDETLFKIPEGAMV